MRNFNKVLLSATDTTSQTSTFMDTGQTVAISFIASFSDSTAAGTLKIQASNDVTSATNLALADGFAPVHWADVPSASASVVAGATVVVAIPQNSYRWLRAVYTETTPGTGVITINVNVLSL